MSRERSFVWLLCLFYRLWSSPSGAGAGSASWAWPRSVNVRVVCWHPEIWLLLFQMSPGVHLWLEPGRRRVQPGLGGREKTERVSCVLFVFSGAVCSVALTPRHATANPDFMGLRLRKENVRVNGWQHLQTAASCLEGRGRQCICFTKIMRLQHTGQIDIYPWTGSWCKGEIFFVENSIFLHSWEILILTYRGSPEFQASLNYYFSLSSLPDLEK